MIWYSFYVFILTCVYIILRRLKILAMFWGIVGQFCLPMTQAMLGWAWCLWEAVSGGSAGGGGGSAEGIRTGREF